MLLNSWGRQTDRQIHTHYSSLNQAIFHKTGTLELCFLLTEMGPSTTKQETIFVKGHLVNRIITDYTHTLTQ